MNGGGSTVPSLGIRLYTFLLLQLRQNHCLLLDEKTVEDSVQSTRIEPAERPGEEEEEKEEEVEEDPGLETRRWGPTLRTRRQEKNSRMDTSSRTKSVERPVRAVDLFIASLDALTLLEGSSTLSARIDSDERATLLASFGWPVCTASGRGKETEKEKEAQLIVREDERSCPDRADAKKKRARASESANENRSERRRSRRRVERGPIGGFLEYLAWSK